VGRPSRGSDQQGSDEGRYQKGDGTSELIEPGTAHVPGEQENRADGEDELDG
jgi:hypothetical protein